jgi:hypothetical protein
MATLRKSAYLHFARVVAIPRKRQTVDGGIDSRYSARRTWTAIDQIAALPLDELKSFVDMGVLRGLSIVDDATCAECYGGRAITLEQIDSVYSYAKKKLPAWLPLGIRIHPTWLAVRPSLSQNIDFMWVQYLERRGDQMTFLNRQAAYAKTLPHPVRVVYGLNFKHFHKNGSMITASELETYGMNSIKMPGNCIFGGFTWTADWRNNGRGAVWDTKLLPLAKQQNAPLTCAAP